MRALVVGSGGREHALSWVLEQSGRFERVWTAPGNGGTPHCAPMAASDAGGIVGWARRERVDLVVIGPEAPLAAGLADRLRAEGLAVVGPGREAARIEWSKAFAKDLMRRAGVPTAEFAVFEDPRAAEAYVRRAGRPLVVKADGLAAGKGVFVCGSAEEALGAVRSLMVDGSLGEAGRRVVIEERLHGPELSIIAISDGERVVALPPARDHKRLLDGDRGPNTGGMGAVAPVDVGAVEPLMASVVQPVLKQMAAMGTPYQGFLYAGLILTAEGPKVLEFNCRAGDPETQAQLPLVDPQAFVDALLASAGVAGYRLERAVWPQERPGEGRRAAACVVLAAPGYPVRPLVGDRIEGLQAAAAVEGVLVFHAGTRRRPDGAVETAGGRVLNIVGVGSSPAQAIERAYRGVERVRFEGVQFRRDIGRGPAASDPSPSSA